jgi:integrase
VRLATTTTTGKQLALLTFLLYQGHLHPGYDYLLERRLWVMRRETLAGPYGPELHRFEAAAKALDYGRRTCVGSASGVAARLLIQTGRPLEALEEHDFVEFEAAIAERERRHGRLFKDYRNGLYTARTVIYHLGSQTEPATKAPPHSQWSWARHLEGVPEPLRDSFVRYLECCVGTHTRLTVSHMATRLAHFGRLLTRLDPGLTSLADLDRQRHIEPFLQDVAVACHRRTGAPLAASERRSRIQLIGRMLSTIAEWGWPEAPARRLIFARDVPRLPRALPRYIPPDADRRLVRELERWPNRLRADALLLLRATGLRIGELVDLELDCVHEIPGQGAWLKVPLGKLDTERMVPLDDETLVIVDRIATNRSPGRPLRHPRSRRLVEFLLTHQGRRISRCALREELASVAKAAGLDVITPHQLRHTYATALVNAGVSLQALMQLLGHSTAEMSLRLWPAVRCHPPRGLRTCVGAGQGASWPSHSNDPVGGDDWELAGIARHQGAAGRWLLPTDTGPGCVPLRQHLRTLPELPLGAYVLAHSGYATCRYRSPGRRCRSARMGR